jgi:hypothetical protein
MNGSKNLYIKRRVIVINDMVKKALINIDPWEYTYHDYVDEIAWSVWDGLSKTENGKENLDTIIDYVRDNYWKEIETYYLETVS